MKSLILIIGFLTSFSFAWSQQVEKSKVYHSLFEGLKTPEKVFHLDLDGAYENDSLILLKRFPNLVTLTLRNHPGPNLPSSISNVVWLKRLRLINDDFYEFPIEFTDLEKLEAIELIHDTHLELKSTFFLLNRLPQLRELRIEGLSGQAFADYIEFPEHLQVLSLRNNHLNSVPLGIKNLKELRLLDLGSNEFLEIPNYLVEMNTLDVLFLDHQPYLHFDHAFEILTEMKFLHELHLEGNYIDKDVIDNRFNFDLNEVFLGNQLKIGFSNYKPNLFLPAFPKHSNQIDKASFKIKF